MPRAPRPPYEHQAKDPNYPYDEWGFPKGQPHDAFTIAMLQAVGKYPKPDDVELKPNYTEMFQEGLTRYCPGMLGECLAAENPEQRTIELRFTVTYKNLRGTWYMQITEREFFKDHDTNNMVIALAMNNVVRLIQKDLIDQPTDHSR